MTDQPHPGQVTAPLVSVVVPAYNASRFVGATLRSIAAQTEPRWECIVVDDGSRDNTLEAAREAAAGDARIRFLRTENGGVSAARNAGYAAMHAASRFVAYQDADDLWHPDALACLLSSLEACPSAVGAHGLARIIDGDGVVKDGGSFARRMRQRLRFDGAHITAAAVEMPTDLSMMVWENWVYPPGVLLLRRAVCQSVGPWDQTLANGEDWDMWIRVLRHGAFVFVDRPLVDYRRHDGNATNDMAQNIAAARFMHYRAFFAEENNEQQRAMMRGGWRAWQRMRIVEKAAAMRSALGRRDAKEALRMAAHIGAHSVRYLRGYPVPKGV